MKPRKLFTKLFPPYFFISLIGLVILVFITRFTFSNFYFDETKTHLIEKAKIIEPEILGLLENSNPELLAKSVQRLGKIAKSRITVILPNGLVVADSSFNPIEMENHATREEVASALQGEIGEASRFSPTLEENFLYVAIPLKENGEIKGVLRNAVTKSKLEASLSNLTEKVIIWSFVLLIILTYFIYIQAKKISSPLEEIRHQVEILASGDFVTTLIPSSNQSAETYSLAKSIKSMGDKIQQQFEKINNQKNEQLAVFASMLEGVITITPDMTVYHINESALKLFGAGLEKSVRGIDLKELVKSAKIVESSRNLLESHIPFSIEVKTSSGLILDVHGAPLKPTSTNRLGAVLVFNDVTKIRNLEAHRREFVANVSHELKTPLTAIQGYLETLSGDILEDKKTVEKFLTIINKHAVRLKTIVEDLLALSSIEKEEGRLSIEMSRVSADQLISNVISLCSDKASRKGVNLVFKQSGIHLSANVQLMEQALINLVDNAISYSREGDEIVLKCELVESLKDTSCLFSVRDNGIGIAKEHHERLFERFYSVDKARSRELGGSGLGLSIVKHIALTHGGNVRVESEVGVGSEFIIAVPQNLD